MARGGRSRDARPSPPPARRRRSRSRSRSPAKRHRGGASPVPSSPRHGGGGGDRGRPAGSPAPPGGLPLAAALADAVAGLADKGAGVPPPLAAPHPSASKVARLVEVLLDVERADWVAARLAARLLPPLIARVPSQLDPAVSVLIKLADGAVDALWPRGGGADRARVQAPGVKPLVETASADAVASLGSLIAWAGRDLPPGDPAVQRAVGYLLGRWGADPRAAPGGRASGEGGGRGGARARSASARPASATAEPEEGEATEVPPDARAALRAAFRANPKAVLAGVAAAAGAGRPADAAAAGAAVRGVLLAPDPDWVTRADAATDAGAGPPRGPSSAYPDPPPTLAAAVAGPDPGLRCWLDSQAHGGGGGGGGGRSGGGVSREGARLMRAVLAALPPLVEAAAPVEPAVTPAPAPVAAATGNAAASDPTPCLIGPALLLSPLPPAATPADVEAAAARHARIRSVRLVTLAHGGTAAAVACEDVSAAALVFEGLARAHPPPWWGRAGGKGDPPPVNARFVPLVDEEEGGQDGEPAFVWAPGVGSDAALAAATAALSAAGIPPPSASLRVGGRAPCIIFQFGGGARVGRAAAGALAAAAAAAAQRGSGSLLLGATQATDGGGGVAQPALADDDDGPAPDAALPGAWAGLLAKAGLPVCDGLECLDGPCPGSAPGTASACEPVSWPPALDVSLRVDVAFVLQAVLAAGPPDRVTVRRLALAPTAPRAARTAFIEFLNALASRRRAGVVEVPGSGSGRYSARPEAASAPPRRLYLVPPSNSVAARLGVEWAPMESLFVVVAPPE